MLNVKSTSHSLPPSYTFILEYLSPSYNLHLRVSTIMNYYLFFYNAISAIAWLSILAECIGDLFFGGYYRTGVYSGFPHKLMVVTQTVNAVFEVVHAIIGLVPSPLLSLFLQFFARLVITVGISYYVPESEGNVSVAYAVLTVAWSVTEIVRYSFYVSKQTGRVPYSLLWLRYLTFVLLYPMGLLSEPIVVFKTLAYVSGFYYWFLALGMFLYVPGFIKLYGYMWRQRGRYLRAEPAKAF